MKMIKVTEKKYFLFFNMKIFGIEDIFKKILKNYQKTIAKKAIVCYNTLG